jgi:hypothetical protein
MPKRVKMPSPTVVVPRGIPPPPPPGARPQRRMSKGWQKAGKGHGIIEVSCPMSHVQ